VSELERKLSQSVTVKSADRGLALARFSTPDGMSVDRDGDITAPGSFQEGAKAVISPWGHTSVTAGSIPAGRATIHADGTASLKFFLSTEAGRATFESVKELADIVEFSYGFHVTEEAAPTAAQRAQGARRVLKSLRVYEVSPVVLGAGVSTGLLAIKAAPPAVDRAELEHLVKQARRSVERRRAWDAALQEPLGPLALDIAEKATRWLSEGRVQEPPMVKFFDPDGERSGYYSPRDPDAIYVARGLSVKELVLVVGHEVSHLLRWPDRGEDVARVEERMVYVRYFENAA